jgi:hypothetical protein
LSRGIRAYRPLGHLGLILTFGTVLSFFYLLTTGASAWSLRLLVEPSVIKRESGDSNDHGLGRGGALAPR